MCRQFSGKLFGRSGVCGALLAVACLGFASDRGIAVFFGRSTIIFPKAIRPFRSQTTVLVPFRETANSVGASVTRNPDGKHVTITLGANTIYFEPGHHGYRLNGHHQDMRASSEIRDKHLYVPIRLFTDLTKGRVHAEIL
jgi:hypothetical protein